MRLLGGTAAVLVLLFATACGGGSTPEATTGPVASSAPVSGTPGPASSKTPAGPAAAASCATEAAAGGPVISMEGTHALNPSDETISAGESVTWTNNSSTNHHIKFSASPDCGFTLINKSVSVKFDNPGTFAYVCTIHPSFMKGTITVQ